MSMNPAIGLGLELAEVGTITMPGFKLFELPLFASASLLLLDTVGITNEDMSDIVTWVSMGLVDSLNDNLLIARDDTA